jgi:hypothetical protein
MRYIGDIMLYLVRLMGCVSVHDSPQNKEYLLKLDPPESVENIGLNAFRDIVCQAAATDPAQPLQVYSEAAVRSAIVSEMFQVILREREGEIIDRFARISRH